MIGLDTFELAFFYLDVTAKAALICRLVWGGLYRIYRGLFLYLAFDFVTSVVLATVPFRSASYAWIYIVGHSLKALLGLLVVTELYRLAMIGQPALSFYGRRTIAYVLGAAMFLAVCGLRLDAAVPAGQSTKLHNFFSFERTMDAWLMGFLVILSLFVAWFPVRLKRNVAMYIGGFVLYFFARSAGLLLTNLLPPRFTEPLSIAMLAISVGCLATWLVTLRREGEERTVVLGHSWNPDAIQRLTGQLDAINASLVRLSRS